MAFGKVTFTLRKAVTIELEYPATTEDQFLENVNDNLDDWSDTVTEAVEISVSGLELDPPDEEAEKEEEPD